MNLYVSVFALLINQVIEGKYRLKTFLGMGSFGAVYLADELLGDRILNTQVAIKVIPPDSDPTKRDRQLNELIAARELTHPHLLRCFTVGKFQPSTQVLKKLDQRLQQELTGLFFLYLVMEKADYSLQTVIPDRPRFVPEACHQLATQISSALQYLHRQRQVHRDLKPANILYSGSAWSISDFGTVRQLGSQSYSQSGYIGSISYSPPEAFEGIISTAWDIWSLGIVLVEVLTGQVPYQARNEHELVQKITAGNVQLPPLPDGWGAIAQGCLHLDWRQRWTTDQVLAALSPATPMPPTPIIQPPTTPAENAAPTIPGIASPSPNLLQRIWNVFESDPAPVAAQQVSPATRVNRYQEQLPKGESLEMVLIPKGRFLMGSPDNWAAQSTSSEGPQHEVTVPVFYMGKYAVTNAEWKAVMNTNPSGKYDVKFQGDRKPVVGVSWEDAQAFCQKLSQQSGRIYRLPTEAEWEYACRAGTTTPFYFGETITTDQVNYDGNYPYGTGKKGIYRERTTDVGSFPENAFGLFDLHGNVREWCADDWHESYASKPKELKENGAIAWTDSNSRYKLLRGGSWFSIAWYCRSANRFRYLPGGRNDSIGFRLCCSPQ